ncbi:MAG: prephenate dehydrogenase [Cytophagaceae bacterium]|nr:prephenate dehydrogenase [Cytophagaceae bacterium]
MSQNKKKELGFIGFGSFGQFIIPHLRPHFQISVFDRMDLSQRAQELGVEWSTIERVSSCEMVALAVPVQFLEEVLIEITPFIKPDALIMDLSSVKVKPVQLMLKYLPASVDVVGTHPLFGPQSGKHGIAGLNMVVSPVRGSRAQEVMRFFSQYLKLNVLERTPENHDRQMAYVQALTHFVGRAVNAMDIPDVEQKTPAYQYLLDIKRNLGQDSWDLFFTIENENPFAKDIREQFLKELHQLQGMLEDKAKQ